MEDLPSAFSVEEFQGMWRVAREKTSSAGNIHFGHMKAIATDNFLSQVMTWVMSIPMLTGFSPELYQQMTACFLEKKPGVFRINKMRTIWLIDCIFSSSCKILARRTYRAATKHNQLAKEDFGGQKGISAAMQAVNL